MRSLVSPEVADAVDSSDSAIPSPFSDILPEIRLICAIWAWHEQRRGQWHAGRRGPGRVAHRFSDSDGIGGKADWRTGIEGQNRRDDGCGICWWWWWRLGRRAFWGILKRKDQERSCKRRREHWSIGYLTITKWWWAKKSSDWLWNDQSDKICGRVKGNEELLGIKWKMGLWCWKKVNIFRMINPLFMSGGMGRELLELNYRKEKCKVVEEWEQQIDLDDLNWWSEKGCYKCWARMAIWG